MEKEALLKIIIQDIRELDTLLNTFTGKPEIPKTFINLSRSKVKGILEELDLLESLADYKTKEFVVENKPEIKQVIAPEPTPVAQPLTIEITEPVAIPKEEKKAVIHEPAPAPIIVEVEEQKIEEKFPLQPQVKSTDLPKTSQTAVLGEKLGRDAPSYNESIAQKKETDPSARFQTKPIDDLRRGIGINDRFYFTRELFNGNAELMNQTLDQLNQMQDLKSAESFLETNFTWEGNNEAVRAFNEIVRRRFL
jgi:hypothetical protein